MYVVREPDAILAAIQAGDLISREEVEAWIRHSAHPTCVGPLCLTPEEMEPFRVQVADPRIPYDTIWVALRARDDLIDKVQPYVPAALLMGQGAWRTEDRILLVLWASIGCGQDLSGSVARLPMDGTMHPYSCPRCGRAQYVTTMTARVHEAEEAATHTKRSNESRVMRAGSTKRGGGRLGRWRSVMSSR